MPKRLIPAAKAKAVNHTRYSPNLLADDRLPWLELRSTAQPPGPISATATPALGGAIIEGNALPVRWQSTCYSPGI